MYSDVEYLPDVFLFGINFGAKSRLLQKQPNCAKNQDKQSKTNKFICTYLHINTHVYSSKVEKVTVFQTDSVTRILKGTRAQLEIFPLQIIKND